MRSSYYNYAGSAYILNSVGGSNNGGYITTNAYAVRPAFHLDLTAAEQAAGLDLPTDETITYDGVGHKLVDRQTLPTWYYEAIYGDATRVSVEYSADSVIDAGTYEVTLKLLDNTLAWKTNKPDTGNGETDRIRKFRIQIDPRKLSIDWSGLQAQYVWDANLQSSLANYAPTFSGAIAADGVTLSVSYDTDVADLAKIGRHTVTATMSATDPTRFAKNYNILSALSKTYTVDKATQVAQNISIDYERELLIESAAQTNGANRLAWLEYKDRGGNWVSVARADGSGGYELGIVEDMMRGADVEFRYRVPGELAEYVNDLTFTHAIPARPTGAEAPTLQYATETATVRSGYRYAFGQTDAPTAYEVSTGIAIELAPLGGTSYIADYGATEYKIYYYAPATSTSFHSEIGALTIPARSEAPKLTINYIGEKTMERVLPDVTYTLRDGAEQTGDGNYIDLAPDGDIGILVAWRGASDAAFASTKLQLTIPARPNAPQIVYDPDAGDYTSVEIPTTAMVYRSMAPNANWSAVPTDGLKFRRGQYQFRYKAVADDGSGNGAFASLECSIDYGNATVNLLAQWSLPGKEVGVTETVYNGGIQYPSVQFYELVNGNRAPVEIAAELIHMTVTALRSGNTLAGAMGTVGVSDADTYSVEIDIRTAAGVHDTGYQITENNAVTITVAPMKLRVPSMSELRIVYNGKTDHLPNYLDGLVTITGASEKKDVLPDDAYTAYLTLIRRDNYVWTQDGEELADARCAVQWNITPYELTPDWDKLSFRYQDGVVQRPQVASFGLPTDMAAEEELLKQALTGDWQNTILVGQYTVQLRLDAAILGDLYDNYALVETSVTYRITLGSNGEGNRVEWLEVSGTFRRKYYAGNRFDDTGMIVEAIYSDGTRKEVEYTLGEIVRTQSGAAIAVRYEDASQLGEDGKPVVVEQLVEVTLIEIVEIRLSGTYKTEYSAGDKFNATGLIVEAVYEDGYAEEVRKYEISDNALQKGDVAVTVSYTVLDRTYTADAAITVGGSGLDLDSDLLLIYIVVSGAMIALCTVLCIGIFLMELRARRDRKNAQSRNRQA